MTGLDILNTAFQQAVSFVNHTDRNIFLTGKAGTGKTTFLKYIRARSHKKMAVAAPTGVAAINAGGATLHSLFWLPFGMYLADYELSWNDEDSHIYNRSRLFGKVKLTRQKRAMLQELDLLVIDEVSMVRADTLDAIDTILKSVRRDARPFGGLQLLLIGDMYQLPPVVKERERGLMAQYYDSPFFFDAKVLKEHPPVLLELTKIYRQSDESFISVLNNIRNNCCTPEQLNYLNSFFRDDFVPSEEESYITLTSHNRLADSINSRELEKLPGKPTTLKAKVEGDFFEANYPVDQELVLKLNAQVMFLKNDSGEDRKYYNGKIGYVSDIDLQAGKVMVSFKNGDDDVVVKRETWENIRYDYDKSADKIEEKVLGTFNQYPLRLAWAITIHKSQGLTFDKAIIDAGASFAAGQVYVALSRLRSLEGLVLRSRIPPHSIRTDHQVATFSSQTVSEDAVPEILAASQRNYLGHLLLKSFDWNKLVDEVKNIAMDLAARSIADQDQARRFLDALRLACEVQKEVADKFRNQLNGLLNTSGETDYAMIHERTQKAVDWFVPKIDQQLIEALGSHLEMWAAKKRTKRYLETLAALYIDFKRKREQLIQCTAITQALADGGDLVEVMSRAGQMNSIVIEDVPKMIGTVKKKTIKGDTQRTSLELFQSGKRISEIAAERSLTEGTILGHLIQFIGKGVEAAALIEKEKLNHILNMMAQHPDINSSALKQLLGPKYSYDDIRIAQRTGTLDGHK